MITYTKDNGEIVGQEYARRRIVEHLRRVSVPLEYRRKVADKMTSDRGYRGLLVSFLCRESYVEYVNMLVDEKEATE